MSATGRKRKGKTATERAESDYYPTPAWCVTRLLEHVELPGGRWLEPSAGDGAIIRAVNSVRADVAWRAVELREDAGPALRSALWTSTKGGELEIGNFLRMLAPEGPLYDVAIGNPPFSLAADFVMRAYAMASQVVMLLRLNFLGSSNTRRHLFESCGMPDVYVLPERPSFTGEGTDACEYAWMRWGGEKRRGEVGVLFDRKQLELA